MITEEEVTKGSPILAPTWSKSYIRKISRSYNRVNVECVNDIGGVGAINIFEDDEIKLVKKQSLRNCPFAPKCCSLPLKLSNQAYNIIKYKNDRFNSLVIDRELEYLIYLSDKQKSINFVKLELNDENANEEFNSLTNLPFSSVRLSKSKNYCYRKFNRKSGYLQEVTNKLNENRKHVYLVKQKKQASLIELKLNPLADLTRVENILSVKSDQFIDDKCKKGHKKQSKNHFINENLDDELLISELCEYDINFISENELIPDIIGCGLSGFGDNFISEYNLQEQSIIRTIDIAKIFISDKIALPIGLKYSHDHPKTILIGDECRFGLVDLRLPENQCYTDLADIENINTLYVWEKFFLFALSTTNDFQYLLSSDHHVILIDKRYPRRSLLNWKHLLPCENENYLNLLKISEPFYNLLNSPSGSNANIVALTNEKTVCLFTLNENKNIVQPISNHPPLHVSQPDDFYKFASLNDKDLYTKLSNFSLTGLDMIETQTGFSLLQLTNDSDIFIQDFYRPDYFKNDDQELIDYSWKYGLSSSDLKLDKRTLNWIRNYYGEIYLKKECPLNSKGKCNCCPFKKIFKSNDYKSSDEANEVNGTEEEEEEEDDISSSCVKPRKFIKNFCHNDLTKKFNVRLKEFDKSLRKAKKTGKLNDKSLDNDDRNLIIENNDDENSDKEQQASEKFNASSSTMEFFKEMSFKQIDS